MSTKNYSSLYPGNIDYLSLDDYSEFEEILNEEDERKIDCGIECIACGGNAGNCIFALVDENKLLKSYLKEASDIITKTAAIKNNPLDYQKALFLVEKVKRVLK